MVSLSEASEIFLVKFCNEDEGTKKKLIKTYQKPDLSTDFLVMNLMKKYQRKRLSKYSTSASLKLYHWDGEKIDY